MGRISEDRLRLVLDAFLLILPKSGVGRSTRGTLNTFLPVVVALSRGTLSTMPFAGNHYIPARVGYDSLPF
jgi:hypothetical protein